MADKDLEQHYDHNEVAFADNPDYLQEKSDLIAHLKPEPDEDENVLSDKPYSQRYEVKKHKHISHVEHQLAGMRERGEYGIPEVHEGVPIKADMDFLDDEGKIPEDLKKEM
jgi:hypothetical protein